MVVTQNLNRDNQAGKKSDPELRDLLEKNLEMTDEVLKIVRKIRKDMVWQKVMSVIKILIIVVPLVLSIYYLPQIVEKSMDFISENYFKSLLDSANDINSGVNLDNIDLDKLPNSVKNMLK